MHSALNKAAQGAGGRQEGRIRREWNRVMMGKMGEMGPGKKVDLVVMVPSISWHPSWTLSGVNRLVPMILVVQIWVDLLGPQELTLGQGSKCFLNLRMLPKAKTLLEGFSCYYYILCRGLQWIVLQLLVKDMLKDCFINPVCILSQQWGNSKKFLHLNSEVHVQCFEYVKEKPLRTVSSSSKIFGNIIQGSNN